MTPEQRAYEQQRRVDARSALARLACEEREIKKRLVSIKGERASWKKRLAEAEAKLAAASITC